MRVRLDVAYDGGAFSGWARQPGLRTVEGVLSAALETVFRRPVALTVAGRTDAGVHATGQVVSLDADELPSLRQLNGVLPADLAVLGAIEVPAAFDARFAARGRRYAYRICDRVPDPLRRHDTLAWHRPLDGQRMQAAAVPLTGEHDFAAFCRQREGATTVRTLRRLDVVREGSVLTAHLEADAFCHSMVRALIGALLVVGDGRRPVELPAGVLRAGARDGRLPVAPARGLTLVGVDYPSGAAALQARALESRRLRVPWRQAEPSDIPSIDGLFDEAASGHAATGRTAARGLLAGSAGDALSDAVSSGQVWVALDRGAVIGVVAVGPAPGHVPAANASEVYVTDLVTSRGFAPRGLGRELLARVAERGAAAGAARVRLTCPWTPDGTLVRVFERMGFRATTTVGPRDRPGQVMELQLPVPGSAQVS